MLNTIVGFIIGGLVVMTYGVLVLVPALLIWAPMAFFGSMSGEKVSFTKIVSDMHRSLVKDVRKKVVFWKKEQ